ncbi:dihydrodipicolinate synthase family protein [Acidisphaera sp. L21]|uniref:dihydrodipicolinate synthase family protein n=1 Tax=Acidisphaera sp. L21 TaxID=1641851 RepID=UPI00131DF1A5|nr:dihydrodipicolinate synthase family protein [Acidisphaera sp. L21]
MALFQGLSAFSLTPTDAAGRVQVDLLCAQLERITDAAVDSVGLLGSTGGYAYLSRAERLRAVKAAADCIGGRVPLMVGVGALTTAEAQALARDAEEAGADGLLLAPVSYTPLTEEEVFQHFRAVAGATDLPLCIYNNPSTTHFTFSETLIARLAALPKVAAVKMPAAKDGDFTGEVGRLRQTADGLSIGYSGDWFAADALLAGADAFYSVVAGLLPAPALRLVRAAQAGDAGRTREIDAAFQPLWALFKEFGSFRVMFVMADILSLGRFDPRRPILPLGPDARPRIEAALRGLTR